MFPGSVVQCSLSWGASMIYTESPLPVGFDPCMICTCCMCAGCVSSNVRSSAVLGCLGV